MVVLYIFPMYPLDMDNTNYAIPMIALHPCGYAQH